MRYFYSDSGINDLSLSVDCIVPPVGLLFYNVLKIATIEEKMGLDGRDYMRDRNWNRGTNGPSRKGKLLVYPAPHSFLKKLFVFAAAILVLTSFFKHFLPDQITSKWKAVFQSSSQVAPLPPTGNVTLYQLGQSAPAVASFKVTAKPSRAGISHLVKLVDVGSGQPVLSVFVRSGESADLKVPLGSYKINIATGEQWYGETKLFGKKMVVEQGMRPLVFYAEQNSIMGQTLTLDNVIDGNYPTRPLTADDF
jgi:hypothetical protein